LKNGKPFVHVMQVGEKTYLEYDGSDRAGRPQRPSDAGQHALRPGRGAVRLRQYRFPVQLNDAARTYFQRVAPQQQEPELRADFIAVAGGQPAPR
jgi:hypothetical protein